MASTRCETTMANRLAILLTATIDPRGMTRLKRADPAAREADYAAALAFWQQQGLPVVFCENSGTRSPRIYAPSGRCTWDSGSRDITVTRLTGGERP